jgi:hypothetical protein
MAEFLWIDWNLQKIDDHNLSPEEVETAWENRVDVKKRTHPVQGPYFESLGPCPSGRIIRMIWRYNHQGDRDLVFVITAY